MIEILGSTTWHFSKTNLGSGGLIGKITHCRYKGAIPFYVRENITGINSFQISSSERWGDKTGRRPRKQRQVLELFAPNFIWHEIAQAVHTFDPLHRQVLRSRAFSANFIGKLQFYPPFSSIGFTSSSKR